MPHAERAVIKDADRILVETHWNEKFLIEQVPGSRWSDELRKWHVPLSWTACLQLRGIFSNSLTVGPKLTAWSAAEYQGRVAPAHDLRARVEPKYENASEVAGDKLLLFQRAGVQFLDVASSAILADDMGSGKTVQMLELIRWLDEHGKEALPALVVAPKSVIFNWAAEAATWLKTAVPYVVTGGLVARRKLLAVALKDPSALVIINYEGLRAHSRQAGFGSTALVRCKSCGGTSSRPDVEKKCEAHPRELNVIPFKTIVVDEAHRIVNPRAKQTRAAWAVGQQPTVTRRYALSGTITPNGPDDMWSVLHFIAPNEFPVKSKYVDRYCLSVWNAYGGLDVKGLHPATRDEFYKIIDSRFRRMPKALVLSQLPPKIRSTRVVELTPRQLRAYHDMETQLVTRLPDGSILVAANDLTAQIRLLQLASGTLELSGDLSGYRLVDPSSKLDCLEDDILEEIGDKAFVVSAEHRQLIELASRRLAKLKISHGLITGKQQAFERQGALNDFNVGKIQVLLFTLKAGGEGLNMTVADTQVRLQRSWSMVNNLQGEDRTHRIGSERHESIHYIDVIARDTVEETQLERLWEKTERLEEINRDRATLALAGKPTDDLDAEASQLTQSNLGVL